MRANGWLQLTNHIPRTCTLTLLSTLQAVRLSSFYVSGLGHKAFVAHTENIFVLLCIYGPFVICHKYLKVNKKVLNKYLINAIIKLSV